jgi:hypothetical protein
MTVFKIYSAVIVVVMTGLTLAVLLLPVGTSGVGYLVAAIGLIIDAVFVANLITTTRNQRKRNRSA